MQELTEKNFRREVLEAKKPVLVEFYALWCGKCAMMEDVFELVAEEFDGQMGTGRVETERNPLLTARYRISRLLISPVCWRGSCSAWMTGVMEPEEMAKRLESKKI